jgi:hypothetical protein
MAALVLAGPALAQDYPTKPVKVIVPFPAAGPTDVVARLVAQKLSEKFGQQFYIENMSGAGGNLGMGTAPLGGRRLHDPVRVVSYREHQPLRQTAYSRQLRAGHHGGTSLTGCS